MVKHYEAFKKLTAKRQNAKRLKENKEQRMLLGVGSGEGGRRIQRDSLGSRSWKIQVEYKHKRKGGV